MLQSNEEKVNQSLSEYVQQSTIRFSCLPEKLPYNNPGVASRNQMIKQARKESKARHEQEVEKGFRSVDMRMPKSKYGATDDLPEFQEGGQAEDAHSSSEDENLAHKDNTLESFTQI